MVNLKEKPFYLKEEDIKWVEETIAGMTTEEKIGQLFVYMVTNRDPAVMKSVLDRFHVGAIRYHNAPKEELYEQNRILQENSKIPLLIASNCEAGGNGGIEGGTAVANGAAVAAADSEELAYEMSCVGASESAAVGCNWNFAPVVDLLFNWRNTIVQTRAFRKKASLPAASIFPEMGRKRTISICLWVSMIFPVRNGTIPSAEYTRN